MVGYEEDVDELLYVGQPPRRLRRGLRWRLLISNYAVFFGSLWYAMAAFITMPFIAGIVWTSWNERVIVLIFPLLFVLLFPLLGLAIAIGGVRDGLRKACLLRQGELGRGTILTCRYSKRDLPFPEFLNQWQELQTPQPHPFWKPLQIFYRVWSGLIIGFTILSVIICSMMLREIAVTGGIALGQKGMRLTGSTAVVTALGYLVACLATGLFILSGGRRVRSVWSGQVPPASLNLYPQLSCTFEYRLPDGDIFKAEDTVTFNSQLDEPTQPVLYDPARPDRAILLNGLCPRVRVAPDGSWEAGEGPGALCRTVVLTLCWLGSLPMSYIVWSTIAWFTHEN